MAEQINFNDIAAKVLEFNEGEIIPHSFFRELLGVGRPRIKDYETDEDFYDAASNADFKYLASMEKLRDHLLSEFRVYLKNEYGVGYFICSPNEQVKHGIGHTEKVVKRKLNKGVQIVVNVDYQRVDVEILKEATDKQAAWSAIRQLMRRNKH